MDISINLLPKEINAHLVQKGKQRLQLAVGGVIVVALAGAYIFLSFNTLQTQGEVAQMQKEHLALENQVKDYEPYVKLQTRVASAEKVVRSAMGTPPDLQQVLAGIGLYIPPNVWLTDFSTALTKGSKAASVPTAAQGDTESDAKRKNEPTPPTPVGEVVLRGWTFDHLSVAGWLEEIRQVPGLTDIRCQYSTEEELEGQAMVRFEIKASILPGADYQPPKGKAGT